MTITPGVPTVRHLTVDVHSREFLPRLSDHGGACTLEELYPVDYERDKARRKCRRWSWAKFEGGYWRLTPEGEAILGRITPDFGRTK